MNDEYDNSIIQIIKSTKFLFYRSNMLFELVIVSRAD